MARVSRAAVLVALGCPLCLGQQPSDAPAAGMPTFERAAGLKHGKVPKPPACPAMSDDSLETNGIALYGQAVAQPGECGSLPPGPRAKILPLI